MRTIWIARHGNREDFVDPGWVERAERPYDPGLSADGLEQARQLAGRLAGENISRIYSPPYLQTVETAHAVAEGLDLPVYLEPGFGEWLNPIYFSAAPQLLSVGTLRRRFPRVSDEHEAVEHPVYPESEHEVAARSARVSDQLLERTGDEDILLVGHGATVTFSIRHLVPEAEPFSVRLCSITRIVVNGRYRKLALRGDVSHLSRSEASARWSLHPWP